MTKMQRLGIYVSTYYYVFLPRMTVVWQKALASQFVREALPSRGSRLGAAPLRRSTAFSSARAVE